MALTPVLMTMTFTQNASEARYPNRWAVTVRQWSAVIVAW